MTSRAIQITKYLLAILFIYAGVYKISSVSLFASQMYQSPLLPSFFVPVIAIGLPIFEIVLGTLLIFFSKLEYTLLLISFSLMFFFSLYLIMLFTLYSKPPCSCGGILSQMSYPVHIGFNIFFTILSAMALYLHKGAKKRVVTD
ncbi:MAG TPA: MauE/DoxX family redox-associated membrane protein [Puia sp.]|nr:MauE/DoxX family redox-associated membrane protein [Puia sp.]